MSDDALERPHVKGILRPAVPRTFAPEFAVGFFIGGLFLQRHDLGFRQHQPFLGYRGFQRLQPLPHHLQVMPRNQIYRTLAGEIVRACFRNSFATRTWP